VALVARIVTRKRALAKPWRHVRRVLRSSGAPRAGPG